MKKENLKEWLPAICILIIAGIKILLFMHIKEHCSILGIIGIIELYCLGIL